MSCGCHQSLCPCPKPLRAWGQTQSSGRGWWGAPAIPSTRAWHPGRVVAIRFPSCCAVAARTNLPVATHAQIPAKTPETASNPRARSDQGTAFPCLSSSSEISSAWLPPLGFVAAMPRSGKLRCRSCKGFLFLHSPWKSPSLWLGAAFSDHSRQQSADSSPWCELSPVSPAISSQKSSSSVL